MESDERPTSMDGGRGRFVLEKGGSALGPVRKTESVLRAYTQHNTAPQNFTIRTGTYFITNTIRWSLLILFPGFHTTNYHGMVSKLNKKASVCNKCQIRTNVSPTTPRVAPPPCVAAQLF